MEERKRDTNKDRGEGSRKVEGRRERTRVLRRCAVTDDPYFQMYYIPSVLLSALVCSARSEIPVATACRRSGSRVGVARRRKEKKRKEKKSRKMRRWRKRWKSEASNRDYRRREERRKKNDGCINTARSGVYIFMCRLAMLGFRRAR